MTREAPLRLLHYTDVENGFDTPERLGRLVTTLSDPSDAIVVGSGDVLAPSVLGIVHDGAQAAAFYEAVDPAAETFGNHDFDVGVETLRRFVRDCPTDWVSANVFDGSERFAGVSPTKVVRRGERSVGLVGVTDPATSVPDRLRVTDPVDAAATAAESLLDRTDHVVVTAHAGGSVARTIAGLEAVDVVLHGHRHVVEVEWVGATPVVTAGCNGEAVQQVSLDPEVDVSRREVATADGDEALERTLRSLKSDAGLLETVARAPTPVPCERARCFEGPCRVLDTVASAYRWAGDADVGVVDTRALRDRPALEGDVTAFDLVSLVPFDGPLYLCSLSGQALRSLIAGALRTEDGYRERPPGEVDWMAQFAGVEFEVTPEGDVGAVTVDDTPLAGADRYRVATNPYVVGTEMEFDAIGPEDTVGEGVTQYEAVIDYVREHSISEVDASR